MAGRLDRYWAGVTRGYIHILSTDKEVRKAFGASDLFAFFLPALLSQRIHRVGDRCIVRAIGIPLIPEILCCADWPVKSRREIILFALSYPYSAHPKVRGSIRKTSYDVPKDPALLGWVFWHAVRDSNPCFARRFAPRETA